MVEVTQEPTAEDLRVFGYAPGNYVCRCIDCEDNGLIGRATGGAVRTSDKRAWRCEEHAAAAWKIHLSNKASTASTEALQDRVKALEAALRPFARAEQIAAHVDDGRVRCVLTYAEGATETFCLADLDAARKALGGG